jgi:hypothetical protein
MTTRREMLALALASLVARPAAAQLAVPALPFSTLAPGSALPQWLEPYEFPNQPRHTQFALVQDAGRTVLRARADASTSGLVRRIRVEPVRHPLLAWRWKVTNLPERGDLARKEGDDFAARLYLIFDLDPALLSFGERMKISLARAVWGERVPLAALCYVWDSRAPLDSIAPNAYTDRVRMVVADSGRSALGRWVDHERDVDADFRRAFGLAPPPVSAVIVSADTDNTGERTESYFGDIEFRAR